MRVSDIQPDTYQQQLFDKQQRLSKLFLPFTQQKMQVFSSEPLHYRMRAEFRVWHDGDELFHIMFDQQTKEKYRVDHFPPASRLINQMMAALLPLLKNEPPLRRKLFQIDYLSTLSGQILVTLAYHKPLDEHWQRAAGQLKEKLSKNFDLHIIGRARKQKQTIHQDFVIESLPISGRDYRFKQIENSFTQPNAGVNCHMIEWALSATQKLDGDLLELYCGLGNFTIPLASNFHRVLATEISKTSVAAAEYNKEINGVTNLQVLRMSSEEFVSAQRGEREFRRLQGINLADYNCQTVLVDPPRAGLDDATLKMVSEYQHILYISCNPDTLLDNLKYLCQSHAIKKLALFDQFPYTHHAECGVMLSRL